MGLGVLSETGETWEHGEESRRAGLGGSLMWEENTYFIPSGRRQKLWSGVWKAWTSQIGSGWARATKPYLGNLGTEKLRVAS